MTNDPPDYRREGRQEFMLLFFCEHQTFFVKPEIDSALLHLYLQSLLFYQRTGFLHELSGKLRYKVSGNLLKSQGLLCGGQGR